ncbi:MAG: restriction endonuclease subunit S [Colwellia sp.]|nr:restriction endonuclease subunit S [Colwellia sp.]
MAKHLPYNFEKIESFKAAFQIPESWCIESAQYAFNEVRDGTHDSPKALDIGIPLITSKNLKLTGIDFNNTTFISDIDHEEISQRSAVSPGDLLFSMIGTIGNVGIVENNAKFSIKNVALFRENQKALNSKYAFYWLKSNTYQDYLEAKKKGGNQKFVSLGVLRDSPVLIAPLKEQIRIANKLDALLAKVDAAQTRLDKIPNILKRFRQSVLAAATSGKLTKEWRENHESEHKRVKIEGKFELDREIVKASNLPKYWQWVPLGNFAKCARGKFSIRPRNDPTCFNGVYPFIQIGDLPREGGNITSHKQTLNEKGYSVSREFGIGTVVIAIVGATIANTGIVTYPVCFPDSLVGINSPSNVENQYIDYHLRAIKDDIRQASYAGGGQPNIKLTIINPLPLPLPPYEEVLEIIRRVESLFTMADTVEKQYNAMRKNTDRLTQSLLAKAFRGELVPQDPNDEPADKLLAKIAAERKAPLVSKSKAAKKKINKIKKKPKSTKQVA